MEHCGDDYLAALADSMPDSEDWDDLQAVETEACEALSNVLGKEVPDDSETENDETLGGGVDDGEESLEPPAQEHFDGVELDSSTDDEDPDFEILDEHDISPAPSFSLDGNRSRGPSQSSSKYPSKKSVCVYHCFISICSATVMR